MSPENDIGKIEKDQERYKLLSTCKKLTNNSSFHKDGNGVDLSRTFAGELAMWFYDESATQTGSKKSSTKTKTKKYATQDAVDALISFSNIAEKVAPYAWLSNGGKAGAAEHSEISLKGTDEGRKALIYESARFLKQFGLLHMRSDGSGPDFNQIESGHLQFACSYEQEHNADIHEAVAHKKKTGTKSGIDIIEHYLQTRGLYVKGNDKETERREFIDGLKPYAKKLCSTSRPHNRKRHELEKEQDRLNDRIKEEIKRKYNGGKFSKEEFDKHLVEERALQNKVELLSLDETALVNACEDAFFYFEDDERISLATDGYVTIDVDNLYQMSLLFHDCIELFMAIKGDEKAFKRLLPKFHMEVFEVSSQSTSKCDARTTAIKNLAKTCFTLWFESCGRDPENPGSELGSRAYETTLLGVSLELKRQTFPYGKEENYGGGRSVYKLCIGDETPDSFEQIVRNNLQYVLDSLIEEGLKLNYKNRFAKSASIDPKQPNVDVNNFSTDLMATLWVVMSLINKGDICFQVDRCEYCGRLMNTAKQAGNPRRFCNPTCRSKARGQRQPFKRSKNSELEFELHENFLTYMESGKNIQIGASEHMNPLISNDSQ